MTFQDIGFLLVCLNVTLVIFLTVAVLLTSLNFRSVLIAIGVFNFLIATTAASLSFPEGNFFFHFFDRILLFDRMTLVYFFTGVTLGLSLGFSLSLSTAGNSISTFIAVSLFVIASNLSLSTIVLKDTISSFLPTPEQMQDPTRSNLEKVASEYSLEKIIECNLLPSAIVCESETKIFVAGYAGMALQSGGVSEIKTDENGKWSLRNVAGYLSRPHGLAVSKGDLFVSRAGQFTKARDGKLIQEKTGCVTRLQDLNQDGLFDYYTDIVSDLPGAQLPDGLHQNNGIAIDANGWLYTTVGSPSDHGPNWHEVSGTILRCQLDGSELEVFASGFRNPFGISITKNGEVFCTDNDSEANSKGDELNHVRKNQFYGHPYSSISGDDNVVLNSVAPIELFQSAQGICVHPTESTQDEIIIYVASFGEDTLYRLKLRPEEDSFSVTKSFVASIPNPIGVAVAPDGSLFVCSHKDRGIYRIIRK